MDNHADRIHALRRLSVETGSLACLGCGYEHNCSVHGCAIMREAAERLTSLLSENERLRAEFEEERAKTKKLVDSTADLLLARDRLQVQVAESQRRERAAVEDLECLLALACAAEVEGVCNYCSDNGENCTSTTEWRGPQEEEEETK